LRSEPEAGARGISSSAMKARSARSAGSTCCRIAPRAASCSAGRSAAGTPLPSRRKGWKNGVPSTSSPPAAAAAGSCVSICASARTSTSRAGTQPARALWRISSISWSMRRGRAAMRASICCTRSGRSTGITRSRSAIEVCGPPRAPMLMPRAPG